MPYSTKELSEIELKIKEEILKTEEIIEKYKELTKPIAPENSIGRVSRMDAINNKSVNDSALEKSTSKLINLRVALGKVTEFEFGICRKCKSQIPIGRILLMPHSTLCVNCASRL